MDAIELQLHRQNTSAFIAVKPTQIVLIPVERVRNSGSGGYKENDLLARSEQIFRIIEVSTSSTPPIITLSDGKMREAEFLLLGEHDAAIAVNDHWSDGAREWIVGDIVRANGYETRALVAERGK